MFEKEAESYATRECCMTCNNINHFCKEKCECWTFTKKGAEFGYNKANEWHFVKDGDLPTEDLRQRTRGYYLTASKYKWHKWFIFDVAYFTGVIFIKGGAILDSVIAWREIVPPMMQ